MFRDVKSSTVLTTFAGVVLLFGCLQAKTMTFSSPTDAARSMYQPVYTIDEVFEENQISTYYCLYNDSDGTSDTYFIVDDTDEMVILARLRIGSSGNLIGYSSELTGGDSISLPAPFDSQAYACNVVRQALQPETERDTEYRTCMYWIDGYGYKLYTVWDLETTLRFLEQLELVE